jgi:hypothetical protein
MWTKRWVGCTRLGRRHKSWLASHLRQGLCGYVCVCVGVWVSVVMFVYVWVCGRRNSSTRKVWILPFRIFSRADVSGRIKILLREAIRSSPDQGFTSHSSGQGQAAHHPCPLQPQRGNGQASDHLRRSSHAQVGRQDTRLYAQLGCGQCVPEVGFIGKHGQNPKIWNQSRQFNHMGRHLSAGRREKNWDIE